MRREHSECLWLPIGACGLFSTKWHLAVRSNGMHPDKGQAQGFVSEHPATCHVINKSPMKECNSHAHHIRRSNRRLVCPMNQVSISASILIFSSAPGAHRVASGCTALDASRPRRVPVAPYWHWITGTIQGATHTALPVPAPGLWSP